ncbi:uncharacterized protein BO88DRAFT_446119 [Aspergillus vadensis CBS 113365]|uniref:Uncharacterized protein n=1 Tax=Aspergillus vadensis (strain CBS 113365 / IMI 142717 / IBT 24658) TaxID=1448311 RepID=A0A319B0R1_ASPVC|nr:hypothetical protein BO88DRAFT_446119 [Aspergillus vadensis CBS 113365]PYH65695.1 hypothetical protein BO88DRAFT_446119 [Aspergillus vadensis CBS 113365]
MSSNNGMIRQVLDKLYGHVLEIIDSVPDDGHIDLHGLENVEHVMDFDFEHLEEGLVPPLYFEPMQSADLKMFPPDPIHVRRMFNIDEEQTHDGFLVSTSSRCRQISKVISIHATGKAMSHQNLQVVVQPDSTFFLEANLVRPYGRTGWWRNYLAVEPKPVDGNEYPHIALHLVVKMEARENSILFSEFSTLVKAIRGRAQQPRIDSESKRMESYNRDEAGEDYRDILPQPWSLTFPDEQTFPVLLISCVLPQHARIFAACMYQGKLVIRQSKLYSFEWRDKAPVELFTRVFLSKPVDTSGETDLY